MKQPCRRCLVRPTRRAVSVITVIAGVWDIPRLCGCEWTAPDYSTGARAWTRTPDPDCPYCFRSATSVAELIGVAA